MTTHVPTTEGDRRLVTSAMVLVLSFAVFGGASYGEERNVALGKPYTLAPEPNYAYCTDDGDSEQLTDGKRVVASTPQLWVNAGCVGWKSLDPVEVVIDLGEPYALDSVVLYSGAGPYAEVYLPSVLLAVSDDGRDFRVVHRMDNAQATQLGRAALRAENLSTRGRYVLVRLKPPYGSFVFVEEIQVLRGEHDPKQVRLPEETISRLQLDTRTELQKRLMRALDRLQARVTEAGPAEQLTKRIVALRKEVAQAPSTPKGKARVMAPEIISELNRKVRALQQQVIRKLHPTARVAVWHVSPWAEILPTDVPPVTEELRKLRVSAGRNEYESQAFMLTNLSDAPRSVEVHLKGALGRSSEWGGSIRLRQAIFVEAPEGLTLADALPLLDRPLAIPAWESRQVWLEIHTGEAAAGTYHGSVVLTGDEGYEHSIALTIEVLPVRVPDEVPVATYSWQYVDSISTTKGIEKEAAADLAAHYNNVTILSNNCLPWPSREKGEVDDQGNIVGELDFSALDKWVKLFRPIAQRGMGWFPSLKFTEEIGKDAPRYRTYAQWIRRWVAHLKELGLDYGDFFVYPVDENIRTDFILSGRAIRSVDPSIRIFADPMMRDRDEFLRAAAPYVDLWCPALGGSRPIRPGQMDILRETGKPLWCYTVGRRMFSPYTAYRLALWRAFDLGATGCGFWCYAVGEGWKNRDMWHESARLYAAIYTLEGAPDEVSRKEAIIPSKRWEAWREGIEDYTYLHLLHTLIEERRRTAGSSAQLTEAEEVLQTAVRAVLDEPENVTRADEHRRKVFETLMALNGGG